MHWHTAQALEGADSSNPDSHITCVQLNKSRLAVGDQQGQLVIFNIENDELVFNCETSAFDFSFDTTRGYEIPRAITGLEWLDE